MTSGQSDPALPRPLAAEQRRIATALHNGVLQDLTIAGFRLLALERSAPTALQPDIRALAKWLQERQASLRGFVASLMGETGNSPLELTLTDLSALLPPTTKLVWRDRSAAGSEPPATLRAALNLTAAAILAVRPPTYVEVSLVSAGLLHLAHDGEGLRANAPALTALRRGLRALGLRLRVTRQVDGERLALGWDAP